MKATKSRKAVKPAHGTVELVQPFDRDGRAEIAINGKLYAVEQLLGGDNLELVGYRLTGQDGGAVYDLPLDLSGCDCPDHTFHPERPGGCKHMAALGALKRHGKLS